MINTENREPVPDHWCSSTSGPEAIPRDSIEETTAQLKEDLCMQIQGLVICQVVNIKYP